MTDICLYKLGRAHAWSGVNLTRSLFQALVSSHMMLILPLRLPLLLLLPLPLPLLLRRDALDEREEDRATSNAGDSRTQHP